MESAILSLAIYGAKDPDGQRCCALQCHADLYAFIAGQG